MNNKLKIAIEIIAVILVVVIIINIIRTRTSDSESSSVEGETQLSDILYDEETGEYYIEDAETGEVLHTAQSEDELYIYTIDPDYDPKIPASDEDLNESEEYIDEEI